MMCLTKWLNATVAIALMTIAAPTQAVDPPAKKEGDAPTKENVEKAMKVTWERKATTTTARSALTLNSVKFGTANKATLGEVQIDGIPEGATVTPALVDFTVRTYYSDATQVVQRVRETRVYKDKFNEWAVMIHAARGEDKITKEPAQK